MGPAKGIAKYNTLGRRVRLESPVVHATVGNVVGVLGVGQAVRLLVELALLAFGRNRDCELIDRPPRPVLEQFAADHL